jgi:hypothetical protein
MTSTVTIDTFKPRLVHTLQCQRIEAKWERTHWEQPRRSADPDSASAKFECGPEVVE